MAATNIVEHVYLLYVGAYFGYMPRSGISGSSGNTMSNFLENCQTDFSSGCTSLQSHQQWRSDLSPHPCSIFDQVGLLRDWVDIPESKTLSHSAAV